MNNLPLTDIWFYGYTDIWSYVFMKLWIYVYMYILVFGYNMDLWILDLLIY